VLSVTVAALAAGFTMYTYLPAILEPVVDGPSMGWVYVLYGGAATLGSALSGRWTDRIGPVPVLRFAIIGVGLMGLVMPLARHNLFTALAAVIVWSCTGWAVSVPQQYRLLGVGPDVAPVLLGWNASANYAGIALGAVFGGITLELGSAVWLGPVAACCSLIALLLTTIPILKPAA
jgi:predicted MFS family arabinose efflux permease